jgi:uncharacterized membrane protein
MKKHLYPLVLIVITILAWAVFLPDLPKELPIHWSLSGAVNGTATKGNAFVYMVSLMVFLYGMFALLPKIDPKKENYKYFTKGYLTITNSVLTLFFVVNMLIIFRGVGFDLPIANFAPVILGAVLMVLGNFLQQVRTNFFIGIRTPWTLSSEVVWRKTHRFAAKVFFFAGILLIFFGLFSVQWARIGTLVIIGITIGLPTIYSYLVYRNEGKARL